MIRGACLMAMLAAALAPPLAAQARQYDPLRCEAIEMRKESQMYKCLARCDRQDARRTEPSETKLLACQDRCDTHYQNSMDRVEGREVCGGGDGDIGIDQAEPNRCTARLMRAEASALTCESRCGVRAVRRESFDEDGCLDKCDDRHDKTVDRLLSKSFCAGVDFPK